MGSASAGFARPTLSTPGVVPVCETLSHGDAGLTAAVHARFWETTVD